MISDISCESEKKLELGLSRYIVRCWIDMEKKSTDDTLCRIIGSLVHEESCIDREVSISIPVPIRLIFCILHKYRKCLSDLWGREFQEMCTIGIRKIPMSREFVRVDTEKPLSSTRMSEKCQSPHSLSKTIWISSIHTLIRYNISDSSIQYTLGYTYTKITERKERT